MGGGFLNGGKWNFFCSHKFSIGALKYGKGDRKGIRPWAAVVAEVVGKRLQPAKYTSNMEYYYLGDLITPSIGCEFTSDNGCHAITALATNTEEEGQAIVADPNGSRREENVK